MGSPGHVKLFILSLILLTRSEQLFIYYEFRCLGDHGTKKKDTSSKSRKETKLTSKKRKKNLTDGGSSVPKISRKSEDKNIQSVGVEGEANVRPALKNKNNHKRSKAALNSMHDNGGIEKKKQKHGFKSDMHKNFIKKKRKLPTDGNRTESLDKKLEARRKRRAKGKVFLVISLVFVKEGGTLNY